METVQQQEAKAVINLKAERDRLHGVYLAARELAFACTNKNPRHKIRTVTPSHEALDAIWERIDRYEEEFMPDESHIGHVG